MNSLHFLLVVDEWVCATLTFRFLTVEIPYLLWPWAVIFIFRDAWFKTWWLFFSFLFWLRHVHLEKSHVSGWLKGHIFYLIENGFIFLSWFLIRNWSIFQWPLIIFTFSWNLISNTYNFVLLFNIWRNIRMFDLVSSNRNWLPDSFNIFLFLLIFYIFGSCISEKIPLLALLINLTRSLA